MASLREYRKKIKSVKSTQQITKAMKMVAAARLRRAQSKILSARPFAQKLQDLVSHLTAQILTPETFQQKHPIPVPHPLMEQKTSNKIGLLLVTADKGLCGAFNTQLIRKAAEFLKENTGKDIVFFAVGRKGRDFFKRFGYPIHSEYVNIFNKLSYAQAEIIGDDLMKAFLQEGISKVVVIYSEFKSVMQQVQKSDPILPIVPPMERKTASPIDYLYEPPREELLAALLPRYLKGRIYRILLESFASELGSRMTAMDSATKNAKDMIELLTLRLNRTRQAMITREIAELVGGAEALK